eukprot:CAMPEP_0185773220 /NCGR_PEP_ID=MMETSP1174-20130828/72515_1 /TAXON_ID=35687 /ORGANISM="Dictyocha speculum, Strain CCMP1381" /LENGTH=224 /DNA_ID=CAMNT_0028459807 /DNA_START=125 /DNA_END=799 /DNA_ORIENTATION=+
MRPRAASRLPAAMRTLPRPQMSVDAPRADLSSALLKTTVSTAAGAVCGSVAHEVARSIVLPAHSLVDVSINVADIGFGIAAGGTAGMLWAVESALVKSGVITATLQSVTATIKLGDGDQAAGARVAEAVRSLEGVQGWLVRTSLELGGVSVEKAFERAAAEGSAEGAEVAGPTVSELLGIVVEETLAARAFDLRALLVTVSAAVLVGLNGLLLGLDLALTRLGG